MFRIFLGLAAALALTAPAYAKERSFVLGGFERIVVEGDIVVEIETDASPKAEATGTQDQLDRVQLNRNGDTLTARLVSPVRTSREQVSTDGPLILRLATRRLSQIILRGNGEVKASSLNDRSVRVLLTGNGIVSIGDVTADQLYVNVAGAGTVAIDGGSARKGDVQLNGPANWQAGGFVMDRLDLNHSGPATSAVEVEEFARVFSNGTGNIAISGTADCDIRSTGSARITCGNGKALRQP